MNKNYFIVYLLIFYVLASCSSTREYDIHQKTKIFSNLNSRRLANLNTSTCKSLVDSYFLHLNSSSQDNESLVIHRIPFSLKSDITSLEKSDLTGFLNQLQANYPGARLDLGKTDLYVDEDRIFTTSIPDRAQFDIVESAVKGRNSKDYHIVYRASLDSTDQEFYYDSLSILLNQKMIRLKVGDLKGQNILQKLKIDLMIKNISFNFLDLKEGINKDSYDKLLPVFESVLKNLSEFKHDIYLTKDSVLINNYMDLMSEISRLKNYQKKMEQESSLKSISLFKKIERSFKKIKNFSFTKYFENNKKLILENKEIYDEKLRKLQSIDIKNFNSLNEFNEVFQQYIFLKQLGDESSVFKHLVPNVNYSKFYSWYTSYRLPASKEVLLDSNDSMREYFLKLVSEYKQFDEVHPSWKIWKSKEDKVIFKKIDDTIAISSAKDYNESISVKISDIKNFTSFKRKINTTTLNFKSFESKFNHIGFAKWLDEKGIPHFDEFQKIQTKYPNYTLGEYISKKYFEYAPYAKFDEKLDLNFFEREAHRLKARFGKLKARIENCSGLGSCINEIIVNDFKNLFKKDTWAKKFSCLIREDLWQNSIFDFALFSATVLSYYSGSDAERFPWELVSTALVFNAFHDEANCKVSKKPLRDFGSLVDPNNLKASKRITKQFKIDNFRNLMVTSAYSSLGLTAFNMGYNSLYSSLGYPISENISLKDSFKLYAFNLLYFAVWSPIKKILVYLPLRHKVLPKVVIYLQKKYPGRFKNGVVLSSFYNRFLETNFYIGMSLLNTYDYLNLYRKIAIPWMMNYFGIDIAGYDSRSVESFNKIVLDINGGRSLSVHHFTYANGISSKVLYSETKNEKENVKTPLGVELKISEKQKETFLFDYLIKIGDHLILEETLQGDKVKIMNLNNEF